VRSLGHTSGRASDGPDGTRSRAARRRWSTSFVDLTNARHQPCAGPRREPTRASTMVRLPYVASSMTERPLRSHRPACRASAAYVPRVISGRHSPSRNALFSWLTGADTVAADGVGAIRDLFARGCASTQKVAELGVSWRRGVLARGHSRPAHRVSAQFLPCRTMGWTRSGGQVR
jgi:hypothetical protein